MKHSLEVTLVLVALFLGAQIIGLVVTHQYIDEKQVTETGEINITYKNLPSIAGVGMERPEVEPSKSIWLIAVAIVVGTVLLLLIVKMKHEILWRAWFFLAVAICLTISFAAFINSTIAFIFGFLLAYLKIFRPTLIIQNFTELFVYGGLAAIFVPILNIKSAFVLLLVISLYDMYAVWKSKHMIKLAKFQTKAKIFAGMLIPYSMPKIKPSEKKGKKEAKETKKAIRKIKIKTAVLGGGDVGFPLLFAGTIMVQYGLLKAMIIPPFVAISLFLLLMKGKKNRFYPAMPFLSIGCLAGFTALMILEKIILPLL
jgi:presenilin-like A22 family membrane protease